MVHTNAGDSALELVRYLVRNAASAAAEEGQASVLKGGKSDLDARAEGVRDVPRKEAAGVVPGGLNPVHRIRVL